MPTMTSYAPGSFCWFELATSDQNAAKSFYSNLFGWVINDVPMGQYEGTPIYGLPLAARYFFGKDLRAVSPSEAAMLVG